MYLALSGPITARQIASIASPILRLADNARVDFTVICMTDRLLDHVPVAALASLRFVYGVSCRVPPDEQREIIARLAPSRRGNGGAVYTGIPLGECLGRTWIGVME